MTILRVTRREFVAGLGSAAAWPLVARAQQLRVPVLGFLASASEASYSTTIAAVRRGLDEAGYVEKQNLLIEYRWANFQYETLPALAAELAKRPLREFVVSGGLMSYGNDLPETYRLIGAYAAQIINGAKPADLPVLQPTKFQFVLNLKTAKALGLAIPSGMLAIAGSLRNNLNVLRSCRRTRRDQGRHTIHRDATGGPRCPACNQDHTYRVYGSCRPRWKQAHRHPRAPWWEHHRIGKYGA